MKKLLIMLMVVAMASFLFVGCLGTTPPVRVAVTGVTLDQETLALVAGGATGTLVETVAPVDATDPSVTWASSDRTVATVAAGVVTPLTAGTADITVTTVDGGFAATCAVTVTAAPVAVTGVTLDPPTLAFTVGDAPVTLVAIVAPVDATDPSVTWASSDRTVATVAAGVVTPLNAGISAITATTVDGGFVATCVVTVTAAEGPAPEPELVLVGIEVDPKTMDLIFEGGNDTDTDTITSVTATYEIRGWDADIDLDDCLFISSNLDVATVSNATGTEGKVTAVGVGTADILVAYVGKFDTLVVTVIAVELDHISVIPSTMELGGTSEPLSISEPIRSVTAYYNDKTFVGVDLIDCEYLLYNEDVVTVDDNGVVTITEGVYADCGTTITVSYTEEGITKTDTIEVTVEVFVIDELTILGVTPPAVLGVPVDIITEIDQYTGTVTWEGLLVGGEFVAATVYTATITLTPKTGYTLTGVIENTFIVTGATPVTHLADSGVVTAVFPAF